MSKKELGQYFTTSSLLQTFVYEHVKHKGQTLLEPSFGAGHLLQPFLTATPSYPMVCYELDSSITPIMGFQEEQTIHYGDFTKHTLTRRFHTIITNPPYVKQKGPNLYIQFIDLCWKLLESNGELLAIVPSEFLKATSASSLLTAMMAEGSFTDVLFPHDESLFAGASVDVVVFRYEKGIHTDHTLVNGIPKVAHLQAGILTFPEEVPTGILLGDIFHVYVGLVSGLDAVFKHASGNLEVLTDKDKIQRFIYTDTFPTTDSTINDRLNDKKTELLGRKIKSFTESNWFQWGAPRNKTHMEAHHTESCLYVRNLTRQKEVCFRGTMQYFGGALLCLLPKTPLTEEELTSWTTFLNSDSVRATYTQAGRFKMGQKQLCYLLKPSS